MSKARCSENKIGAFSLNLPQPCLQPPLLPSPADRFFFICSIFSADPQLLPKAPDRPGDQVAPDSRWTQRGRRSARCRRGRRSVSITTRRERRCASVGSAIDLLLLNHRPLLLLPPVPGTYPSSIS